MNLSVGKVLFDSTAKQLVLNAPCSVVTIK
jgi:hypothetical protein